MTTVDKGNLEYYVTANGAFGEARDLAFFTDEDLVAWGVDGREGLDDLLGESNDEDPWLWRFVQENPLKYCDCTRCAPSLDDELSVRLVLKNVILVYPFTTLHTAIEVPENEDDYDNNKIIAAAAHIIAADLGVRAAEIARGVQEVVIEER